MQRADGSFRPGVTDDKMGNTDQVPLYLEDHSKAVWGEKGNKERRIIGTAGKEKDRFTAQLTGFKSGRKVSQFKSKLSCGRIFSTSHSESNVILRENLWSSSKPCLHRRGGNEGGEAVSHMKFFIIVLTGGETSTHLRISVTLMFRNRPIPMVT